MKRYFIGILMLIFAMMPLSYASAPAVDYSSSPEEIAYLQELLVQSGMLTSPESDGIYNSATISAVARFQEWINQTMGGDAVAVTGMADAQTLNYLVLVINTGVFPVKEVALQSDVQPSTTQSVATSEATNADLSDFEPQEILVLQHSLLKIGLLNEAEASGVYDSTTSAAMQEFQAWVNKTRGEETLVVNGICDPLTRAYLDYCVEQQFIIAAPSMQENPASSGKANAPCIEITSNMYQEDGVNYVLDSTITFSWKSEGDVEFYTVNLVYQDGTIYSLGDTTATSKAVSTDQLQPGLYKLYVEATPRSNDAETNLRSEILFGIPAAPAGQAATRIAYIDAESAPADIQTVQIALYSYGLLNPEEIHPGVLDTDTLESVVEFQRRVNDVYEENLAVLDPNTDQYIDTPTLELLLYSNLELPELEENPASTVPSTNDVSETAAEDTSHMLIAGVEPFDMIALQQKLIEIGMLNGEPSGFYDIPTYSAVKEMQRRLNLEDTGIVDQEFLSQIGQ